MKLLIFTYTLAGLGHLRVTDALMESRPKDASYILLGSIDKFVTWIHRFTSINPVGKYIFLKSQYGLAEDLFTDFYRGFLRITAGFLRKQLLDIIQRNPGSDEIWIVATHFGMAHQLGAIKKRLMAETGRVIRLIVQVTDDTSQHIWVVRGADLTFAPSRYVKAEFEAYAKTKDINFVCEVIPYPICNLFTQTLPKSSGVRSETFLEGNGTIRVAIPISGAAVGIGYLNSLVKELVSLSKRFEFWVLVKKSPFTELFTMMIQRLPRVRVMVGKNDAEIITLYELLYEHNLIHLEITKPSEQAFKAILKPDLVGGSILLFTAPIGRQEVDNMTFLERHGLLAMPGSITHPRSIKLPENPAEAAKYIIWALESGLFARMSADNFRFSNEALQSGEVGADGADQFWKKAVEYLTRGYYTNL